MGISRQQRERQDATRSWKAARRVQLPDRRRTMPVKLTEIPLGVRLVAARQACEQEPDDALKLDIIDAALDPSDTIYWVAA